MDHQIHPLSGTSSRLPVGPMGGINNKQTLLSSWTSGSKPSQPRRVSPAGLLGNGALESEGGPDPGSIPLGLSFIIQRTGIIPPTTQGYSEDDLGSCKLEVLVTHGAGVRGRPHGTAWPVLHNRCLISQPTADWRLASLRDSSEGNSDRSQPDSKGGKSKAIKSRNRPSKGTAVLGIY